MRTWKCPGCSRTIQHSYEALVDVGIPICGAPGCSNEDGEMEMVDEPMPRYGYGWVDGEDDNEGDRWIEIAELDYSDPATPVLGEEIAVIMLRDADQSERKFPGITADRERKAELIVDALNGCPLKTKLVIEMYGGTIQGIWRDNPDVEFTDIVFLEDSKYADSMDDDFRVEGGLWDGQMIYSHGGDADWRGPEAFTQVLDACRRRIDANGDNHAT